MAPETTPAPAEEEKPPRRHVPKEPRPTQALLTIQNLASMMELSVREVWRMRRAGRLPPEVNRRRLKVRAVRYDRKVVEKWLRSLTPDAA